MRMLLKEFTEILAVANWPIIAVGAILAIRSECAPASLRHSPQRVYYYIASSRGSMKNSFYYSQSTVGISNVPGKKYILLAVMLCVGCAYSPDPTSESSSNAKPSAGFEAWRMPQANQIKFKSPSEKRPSLDAEPLPAESNSTGSLSWRDHEITRIMIQKRLKTGYFYNDVENHLAQNGAKNLIKQIDPDYLYFTRNEVADMLKSTFPQDVTFGYRMSALDGILQRLQERQAELQKYVNERLQSELNLNQSGTYDRPADRLATLDEIKALWNKKIVADAVDLAAHGTPQNEVKGRLKAYYSHLLDAVKNSNTDQRAAIIQSSLIQSIDPRGRFFSKYETTQTAAMRRQEVVGIGAVLQAQGPRIVITDVTDSGPLGKTGSAFPGDEVLAVAEENGIYREVFDLPLDKVIELIMGKMESKIRLKLRHRQEVKEISVVRAEVFIESENISHEIINIKEAGNSHQIAFIRIPSFYADFSCMQNGGKNCRSATSDMKALLDSLVDSNVEGFVIDLRKNVGGALVEGNDCLSLFIGKQPTLQIKAPVDNLDILAGKYDAVVDRQPVVVLIDHLTAGAAEFFAAGIRDYERGIVVGYRSAGLGMISSVQALDNDQMLKLTKGEYFRVTGGQIEGTGIMPDISFSFTPQKPYSTLDFIQNSLPALKIQKLKLLENQDEIRKRFHEQHGNAASSAPELNKQKSMNLKASMAKIDEEWQSIHGYRLQGDVDKSAAIDIVSDILSLQN